MKIPTIIRAKYKGSKFSVDIIDDICDDAAACNNDQRISTSEERSQWAARHTTRKPPKSIKLPMID